MPHLRKRYLIELVLHAARHSPLVGIIGHRQVGKTTLLQRTARHYLTFDDINTLEEASRDAKLFLSKHEVPFTALDESQFVPALFPALKERVRKNQRPGQFFLSGSVRFTSRKAIRESLTGRLINFELYPMSISEIQGESLPDHCLRAIGLNEFSRGNPFTPRLSQSVLRRRKLLIQKYLTGGGLPGICFIREESFQQKKIQEQFFTILDRDLKMVHPTSLSYREILAFLQELAKSEGQPLSHSEIRRATGISPVAQKKLIFALEALFLIRLLLIEGGRKGLVVYFEDQAEHRLMSGGRLPAEDQMAALVYRQVRLQWAYRLIAQPCWFHYLTRGGARVPFAVETEGKFLGFIPFAGEIPDRSVNATAASFLKAYGQSKVILFSIDHHFEPYSPHPRILVLPVEYLL